MKMRTSRWGQQVRPVNAGRENRAFTMVEVALCLGIIAFALVAIIGVMPAGLEVQKNNQEQTVVNQDGKYLIEAIRHGELGLDQLTNSVESITIDSVPASGGARSSVTYTNGPGSNRLVSGRQIIGLLSTPRIEVLSSGQVRNNFVSARVRALSGLAADQGVGGRQGSFRYRLEVEVTPYNRSSYALNLGDADQARISGQLLNNLYELRLTFRWPLYQQGPKWQTGSGEKTFRTVVSGELTSTNVLGTPIHLFQPNTFISTL